MVKKEKNGGVWGAAKSVSVLPGASFAIARLAGYVFLERGRLVLSATFTILATRILIRLDTYLRESVHLELLLGHLNPDRLGLPKISSEEKLTAAAGRR